MNIVQISAGAYHSMALDGMGKVWIWGSNLKGQLRTNQYSIRKILSYTPTLKGQSYWIICNLGTSERKIPRRVNGNLILGNYPDAAEKLRTYEARIYQIKLNIDS